MERRFNGDGTALGISDRGYRQKSHSRPRNRTENGRFPFRNQNSTLPGGFPRQNQTFPGFPMIPANGSQPIFPGSGLQNETNDRRTGRNQENLETFGEMAIIKDKMDRKMEERPGESGIIRDVDIL